MGKEGPKDRLEMDRLEMVSREPTWAKKVPRIDKRWFQESQLGKEGPKDRLERVSREPIWAKKI